MKDYWSGHTHPACAPSSAVLNIGVLMPGNFLSRSVGEERCQADSCSDFTFLRMWSRDLKLGWGQRVCRGRTHTHTEWDTCISTHICTSIHTYKDAHMRRVGADELERLDVTSSIIEGCPLKPLHTRTRKIKLSYQWAARSKKKRAISPSLLPLTFLFQPFLKSSFEVLWWTEKAFQLFSVSFLMV